MISKTLLGNGYFITPAPPKETKRAELSRLAGGRHVLSASQLATYALCKRKWAWRYIEGVQEPPHASAALGGRVHHVLEGWLASGVAPDRSTREGAIALAGLKHLPPPGSGVVEHGFLLHTPKNTYIGYIDWQGIFNGLITVLDHKTTSNLVYAKTAVDLLSDIQALIYALFACIAWDSEEIWLLWVYYTTAREPRSPAPTKVKIRLPQVLEKFPEIEAMGEEIGRHVRNKTHPLALPPEASACGAYGGCPHKARCNLSETERLRSIMSEATLENKLGMVQVFDQNQQPSLPQWNTPAAPAVPASSPVVGSTVVGPDNVTYRLNADGSWTPVQPQQPPQFQPPAWNPPAPQYQQVAPQPQQPTAPQQAFPTFAAPPATVAAPTPAVPAFNPPAPSAQQLNAPEGPSAAEPKRGRGRPAGAVANKKLEKLTSDRIAFLAGVHAAVMSGVRDSAQLQAAGEACLVAFASKFGE